MNKALEKTIFLFFVHEVLATHKLALTWDGQYVKGQIIVRLNGSFSKENGRFNFASTGLTRLGEKYNLCHIDKIFQQLVHPRFDSVYRFTFDQKDPYRRRSRLPTEGCWAVAPAVAWPRPTLIGSLTRMMNPARPARFAHLETTGTGCLALS